MYVVKFIKYGCKFFTLSDRIVQVAVEKHAPHC